MIYPVRSLLSYSEQYSHIILFHGVNSQNGFYFVTICTKDRIEQFGEIKDEAMIVNDFSEIVKQQWLWLKEQYSYVGIDEYVVMPNHFHGILIIDSEEVGNGRDRSLQGNPTQKVKPLSELIGAFKTTSSKLIHESGLSTFHWQKSFYDHIIRNDNRWIESGNTFITIL